MTLWMVSTFEGWRYSLRDGGVIDSYGRLVSQPQADAYHEHEHQREMDYHDRNTFYCPDPGDRDG